MNQKLFFFLPLFLFTSLAFADNTQPEPVIDNPAFVAASNNDAFAIRIGILDSGVDYNHPKLKPFIAGNGKTGEMDGWDFRDNDPLPYDGDTAGPKMELTPPDCSFFDAKNPFDLGCLMQDMIYGAKFFFNLINQDTAGHGTHVSGIVQKTSQNGLLVPYRISFSHGSFLKSVVDAIELASQQGVRIINMSFRFLSDATSSDYAQAMAVRSAMEKHDDILFVVAAGNENADMTVEEPRNKPATFGLPNQITVGAVDNKGNLAEFSNIGDGIVDVYAPGVEIRSTWPGGKTHVASGTSMATPFVAGIAARILALNPALTPTELKKQVLYISLNKTLLFKKEHSNTQKSFEARLLGAGFVEKTSAK